jgi:hypothetical protein
MAGEQAKGRFMRKMLWILLIGLAPAMAQQETLISGGIESDGYGGAMLQFMPLKGSSAVLVGGRGGWIVNHRFVLGGFGYGLLTNIPVDKNVLDVKLQSRYAGEDLYLDVTMVGGMLEYYYRPQKLLHFSLQTLIGAGKAGYTTHRKGELDWANGGHQDQMVAEDDFFFIEPGLTMTLNVTSFMRFGAGGVFRYAMGVDLPGLVDGDLQGAGFNLFINFGSF